GPGQTDLQVTLIDQLGVTAFLGSSVYFETVARAYAARHGGTRGLWPLRHAFLVGEPGDWPARRARLAAEHGVAIHVGYGTADLGLVGHEVQGQTGYTLHPERPVQICDPGTGAPLPPGQTGQVVVSTLARGWPMIRFGTGDLSRVLEPGPDGFARRIGAIEGRVGAGVKVREIFVYPDHLARLAADLPGIGAARARIGRSDGRDVVTLELTGPPLPEAAVRDAFRRITRLGADRVVWVDSFSIPVPLEDLRQI
ncbi:MAG: phenylacetate--CoA ligase family protein, partial [Pseudodonghicola sp.]